MNIPVVEPTSEPPFVLLPRTVLQHPPLRHHGDGPEVGLSVFEFAVAGACIKAAKQVAVDKLHAKALRSGKRAIKRQREALTPAGMYAAKGRDFDVGSDIIGGAGSAAYWDVRMGSTGDDVQVEISRRQLLRWAGVSRNASAVQRLEPALRRLTVPIGKVPAVLTGLRMGGSLRFSVGQEWLPSKRFGKVPWPPPTKRGGATAAALWLLIHGMDLRPAGEMKVAPMLYKTLIDRLGIRQQRPAHRLRALMNALDTVNHHALSLGLRTFDIEPVDDGQRVKFIVVDTLDDVERDDHPGPEYYDDLTVDEIDERREGSRREREQERAAANNAALRRLEENLEKLRA